MDDKITNERLQLEVGFISLNIWGEPKDHGVGVLSPQKVQCVLIGGSLCG